MNFENLTGHAFRLYHQYPAAAAALAIVLLITVYKKPKASFKFTLFLLFVAAFFYVIGLFRETLSLGTRGTEQLIHKTKGLDD